ncbi:nucleotide pyrophosphohydrolase [Haloferula sargassicola]|uniref:Nucleotide pyrophosphohydrolase n=1 Tax=Haloferula sargassicola TaxID=490096 RepID=A0ABP9USM0_9BACT
MSDSIHELTLRIRGFCDARDWGPFHNAKDMAVAIAAEAGELMQHFVWQQQHQIEARVRDRKEEIASEMADVAILLMEMADRTGIDLGKAISAKIELNEERYPVAKCRGNNLKYDQL